MYATVVVVDAEYTIRGSFGVLSTASSERLFVVAVAAAAAVATVDEGEVGPGAGQPKFAGSEERWIDESWTGRRKRSGRGPRIL